MTNFVPNDEVAYCELGGPASRKVMTLALPNAGIFVMPPGNNASRSANEEGCKCSIAVCPMTVVLVIPRFSEAVTVTSSMVCFPARMYIYIGVTVGTFRVVSTSLKPTAVIRSCKEPDEGHFTLKLPEASDTVPPTNFFS